MKSYKHIIFDIDGTLINSEYAIIHSLAKTIKEITGQTIDNNNLKFALGITGKEALEKLNISFVDEALKRWDFNMKDYLKEHPIQLFPNINDCLNSLFHAGFQLGIVTSKTFSEYQSDFVPLGIDKYFTNIICADDTLEHKPNPEPLLAYIERAKIDKTNAIYIGDSIYDVQCAKAANITCGLAIWGNNFNNKFQADYCFRTPNEIYITMKQWNTHLV